MSVSSVLVAVKGEQSDDEVVRLGCELLNSSKGKLHILYVIEVERALPDDAVIPPASAKGEAVLQHAEGVAKAYKRKAEAELVQTRQAGYAVVQEAVEKGVDAIVLGIPYRQRYGSFVLGETIPYVLKHAPCRVLIWRDSQFETATNGAKP